MPGVLGELIAGVILGNLSLVGIGLFETIEADATIAIFAEIGVVILLFQVGLETNLRDMMRVGARAFAVALIGVIVPFALGVYLGPLLIPGQSPNTYLFLGATLTATSIGITARVFQDLGRLQSPEARIIIGAAVIDDVLGLVILAVVSGVVERGSIGADINSGSRRLSAPSRRACCSNPRSYAASRPHRPTATFARSSLNYPSVTPPRFARCTTARPRTITKR